jgi:hypothetical protein
MDFTLKKYRQLLIALQAKGYSFNTFEDYCLKSAAVKFVLLRHDVDLKAAHSLAIAKLEAALGIRASYYFRVVPQSNQPAIIQEIASLGHEIGYHYSDLVEANGNPEKAIQTFQHNLNKFRQFYPVETICMHGSPTSKIDNRDLWKTYNYHDFGIIGEPYIDIDFNKVFYLTDTGRCWDGEKYSVRDKIGKQQAVYRFHSTNDIIHGIESGNFPERIMITTHPQRWTNSKLEWLQELVMQSIKNKVKQLLITKQ